MTLKESKLEKVDYDLINWECGRKGSLFRGNGQHNFEKRVLDTFLEGNPRYWGCSDPQQGDLTFTSDELLAQPFYYMERAVKEFYNTRRQNFTPNTYMPFSQSPILLEIDAEPYGDRICKSTTGEGLVISGPICLKDIFVIYSTEGCRIEERNTHPDISVTHQITDIERQMMEYEMSPDKALLRRYETNPEETLRLLCGNVKPHKNPSSKDLDNLRGYIEILRGLFR